MADQSRFEEQVDVVHEADSSFSVTVDPELQRCVGWVATRMDRENISAEPPLSPEQVIALLIKDAIASFVADYAQDRAGLDHSLTRLSAFMPNARAVNEISGSNAPQAVKDLYASARAEEERAAQQRVPGPFTVERNA